MVDKERVQLRVEDKVAHPAVDDGEVVRVDHPMLLLLSQVVLVEVVVDARLVVKWVVAQVAQEHVVLVILDHVSADFFSVKLFKAVVAEPADSLPVRIDMAVDVLEARLHV